MHGELDNGPDNRPRPWIMDKGQMENAPRHSARVLVCYQVHYEIALNNIYFRAFSQQFLELYKGIMLMKFTMYYYIHKQYCYVDYILSVSYRSY